MPLFEKRQYKHFQAHPEGFVWQDTMFRFEQIVGLFFSRTITTQRMNFVKVGEAESAALKITTDTGKKIILDFDEAGFFYGWNSDKTKDISNLRDLYLYLAEHSFSHRLARYLKELKANGYFTHDECRFYPRDKVVFRSKEFPIGSTSFLKSYGYIVMRKKDYGILDKIRQEVSFTKIPQFNTQTNTDVIFYLLEKFFGLTWSRKTEG